MDTDDFKNLRRMREKTRVHEDKTERDVGLQQRSQLFRPGFYSTFVELAIPMGSDGELIVHGLHQANLTILPALARPGRRE